MEAIKIECDICHLIIYLSKQPDDDFIECPNCLGDIELFDGMPKFHPIEIIEVN